MKLEDLDWSTVTQAQARRLVPLADRREQALGAVFNASADGDTESEATWQAAFKLWEDLRVFAICGEKPTD